MTINEYENQQKLEVQEINKLRRNLAAIAGKGSTKKEEAIKAEIEMRINRVRDVRRRAAELAQQLQPALQKAAQVESQSLIPSVSDVITTPDLGARMR